MNAAMIASSRLASIGRVGLGARVKMNSQTKEGAEKRDREKRRKEERTVVIQKEKRKDQEKITASTQKERLINISVQLSNIEEIIKVRNSIHNTHMHL